MNEQVFVTTDKNLFDIPMIHNFLSNEAYWSKGITLEDLQTVIDNSLCFGLFLNNVQIGFARVVSDYAIFGYLCDVFVSPEYRNCGYSKILMQHILSHDRIKGIKKILLMTTNAHFLYDKFNFTPISNPERYMERKRDMQS